MCIQSDPSDKTEGVMRGKRVGLSLKVVDQILLLLRIPVVLVFNQCFFTAAGNSFSPVATSYRPHSLSVVVPSLPLVALMRIIDLWIY